MMDNAKKLLKVFLTVAIVFGVVFGYTKFIKGTKYDFSSGPIKFLSDRLNFWDTKKCEEPILYSIGAIDSKFNLSEEQFKVAIKSAEKLWEDKAGKDLFNFSAKGELKVNLVFDQRQQDTNLIKDSLGKINTAEEKIKAVSSQYNSLQTTIAKKEADLKNSISAYEVKRDALNVLINDYNQKIAVYQNQVEKWNKKGGAPEAEFNRLSQEKAAIDSLVSNLQAKQDEVKNIYDGLQGQKDEINSLIAQYNALVRIFNSLAQTFNSKVNYYNETAGSREEFVTGLFTSDVKGERIDIFQFYDNKDLVTTIAHEMGHAVGLGHAVSENSLMYMKTGLQNQRISAEDLKMLTDVCGR